MKLERVRIRALRSISGEAELEFGEGVNYIVGPNNSGKSNLLRALELALDGEVEYDTYRDQPVRSGAGGEAAPVECLSRPGSRSPSSWGPLAPRTLSGQRQNATSWR
jgi:hypothetical protein